MLKLLFNFSFFTLTTYLNQLVGFKYYFHVDKSYHSFNTRPKSALLIHVFLTWTFYSILFLQIRNKAIY